MMEIRIEINDLKSLDGSLHRKIESFLKLSTEEQKVVILPTIPNLDTMVRVVFCDFQFEIVNYKFNFFKDFNFSSKNKLRKMNLIDLSIFSYFSFYNNDYLMINKIAKMISLKKMNYRYIKEIIEDVWSSDWNSRPKKIQNTINNVNIEKIFYNIFYLNKTKIDITDAKPNGLPNYDTGPILLVHSISKILTNNIKNKDYKSFLFFNNLYKKIVIDSKIKGIDPKNAKINFSNPTYKLGTKKLPRVAVMCTGQLRFDDYISSLKQNYDILSRIADVDFYVFAWDMASKIPSAFNGQPLSEPFLRRVNAKLIDECPSTIRTIKQLKERLPKTYEKMNNESSIKVNENMFDELDFIKGIRLYSENEFERNFGENDELKARYFSLNQSKQFYGFLRGFEMIEGSKEEYDFILRIRPDILIDSKIEFNDLNSMNQYEISNQSKVIHIGMDDHLILSRYKTFYEYVYKPVVNIFENKTLRVYSHKENKIKSCSHKFMNMSALVSGVYFREDIEFSFKRVEQKEGRRFKGVLNTFNSEKHNLNKNEYDSLSKVFHIIDKGQ